MKKNEIHDIVDESSRFVKPLMGSWFTIDFETANSDPKSVCAMGMAFAQNKKLESLASTLVRPPQLKFSNFNKRLHGITESKVKHKPEFDTVWEKLKPAFEGATILAHNASFDFSVLKKVLAYYKIPYPDINYYCTVKMARKVWPDLENHKLNTVSQYLDIKLNHHEASSDARAAALIAIECMKEIGVSSIQELAKKLDLKPGKLVNKKNKLAAGKCMDKKECFLAEEKKLDNNLSGLKDEGLTEENILSKPYFMKMAYNIDNKDRHEVYISEHKKDELMDRNIIPWTAPIGNLRNYNIGESLERINRSTNKKMNYTLLMKEDLDIEQTILLKLSRYDDDESFSISKSEILKQAEIERQKTYTLGSIVPTIHPEQDSIIRSEIEKPLIIMGPPGCGKTIIGAHRIVYLLNEFSDEFNVKNTGVFVYNVSLKNYLQTVFDELGRPDLKVESIDSWAFRLLLDDFKDFNLSYNSGSHDTWVKTRPFIMESLERFLQEENARNDLMALLNRYYNSEIFSNDFTEYTYSTVSSYSIDMKAFVTEQNQNYQNKKYSHDDVMILLCLKYLADPGTISSYAHIFIDEAQDLSSLQLQLLYKILNDKKSMTIAGDLNQRLYPDKSFHSWNDIFQQEKTRKTVLKHNHRMTYETACFVNRFMNFPMPEESDKRGEVPVLKKTKALTHQFNYLKKQLKEIKEQDPKASIAVLHYTNKMCETVLDFLQRFDIKARLAKRDNWEFDSVINISTYHQVKGLEFDYVFILGADYYLENMKSDDDLKHFYVAMTRTVKRLFIAYQNDMREEFKKIDKKLYAEA